MHVHKQSETVARAMLTLIAEKCALTVSVVKPKPIFATASGARTGIVGQAFLVDAELREYLRPVSASRLFDNG
jgi:hypothetical protein